MMNHLKSVLIVAVMALSTALSTGAASALELGMTPSHVFGLWTNINNCLLASAQVVADDTAWQRRLDSMSPAKFDGKKPADVLARMAEFRDKLDRLRQAEGLEPTKTNDKTDGEITPSDVFLNSGHVLNALVDWTIRNSGPDLLVSQFYSRQEFSGKTPSDVFGLLDLADRRLDALLAKHSG